MNLQARSAASLNKRDAFSIAYVKVTGLAGKAATASTPVHRQPGNFHPDFPQKPVLVDRSVLLFLLRLQHSSHRLSVHQFVLLL